MFYIKLYILFIFTFWFSIEMNAQFGFDTTTVYFEIGKTKLEATSVQRLDSLVDFLKENKNLIMIYGYADYLGSEKRSEYLSEKRANIVKDYLINNQIPTTQIFQTTGVGQINERGKEAIGNQVFRRVDVFVKRKEARESTSDNEGNDIPSISFNKTSINNAKTNETLILENINFYPGSYNFLPQAEKPLQELLAILQNKPSLKIRLEGHVCCPNDIVTTSGEIINNNNNVWLSEERAKKVYDFLTNNGINKNRLSYKGFGNTRLLISPETDEEDRVKNRRVEVRIISK